MNKLRNIFKGLTKSGRSMGSSKILKLYEQGKNEELISVLKTLNSKSFIENKFEGELNLLHRACFDSNFEVVKMMSDEIDYFQDIVDDGSNEEGWTALLWAAQRSNIEIAQELLANGASIYHPKKDGMTALHMAASNNDIHFMDLIFQFESEPNIKNNEGWTPAHLASFLNNFDALNLLLENGASLTQRHGMKLTAYEEMVRADNADLLECVYPIVKKHQKERSLKERGFSLLHLAAGTEGSHKCL